MTTQTHLPEFKVPTVTFPKIDLAAVFAFQKANLVALRDVQDIVIETAEAIATLQYGWVKESVTALQSTLTTKAPKTPETALTETKLSAGRAVEVTRQTLELSAAAQRRVAELVAARTAANVQDIKTLVAA